MSNGTLVFFSILFLAVLVFLFFTSSGLEMVARLLAPTKLKPSA